RERVPIVDHRCRERCDCRMDRGVISSLIKGYKHWLLHPEYRLIGTELDQPVEHLLGGTKLTHDRKSKSQVFNENRIVRIARNSVTEPLDCFFELPLPAIHARFERDRLGNIG